MPKRTKINWRSMDRAKLSTAVRIFNAKITRISKKNPSLIPFLPQRQNVDVIRSRIGTRRDFNRELKSLARFMEKGAETPITSKQGIKTTKWEQREYSLRVQQINRIRKEERQRAAPSTEKGTMGSIVSQNLRPKVFNFDKIKPSDWGMYKKGVDAQVSDLSLMTRIEKYKKNYLNAILEFTNTAENVDELYQLISYIPADVLYYAYYDDPLLQINFISDPLEVNLIVDSIITKWEDYIR